MGDSAIYGTGELWSISAIQTYYTLDWFCHWDERKSIYFVKSIDPDELGPLQIDGSEYTASNCLHAFNYGIEPLFSLLLGLHGKSEFLEFMRFVFDESLLEDFGGSLFSYDQEYDKGLESQFRTLNNFPIRNLPRRQREHSVNRNPGVLSQRQFSVEIHTFNSSCRRSIVIIHIVEISYSRHHTCSRTLSSL